MFARECKRHVVGKLVIRFKIHTMCVVTLMVLLGKPLQYVLFWCRSLGFSKARELWSSTAAFTVTFFAAVNRHYDHKQRTFKHRNSQNGSKSTNQKPWPFEPVEINLCFLRGPLRWLASDIFLTRWSKCTNYRLNCTEAELCCRGSKRSRHAWEIY